MYLNVQSFIQYWFETGIIDIIVNGSVYVLLNGKKTFVILKEYLQTIKE